MPAAVKPFISFPAGKLGADPVRLPILAQNDDLIAFSKPPGFALVRDALQLPGPTLIEELHAAIREHKPQLTELGLRYAGCIHSLDAETTGVIVLARQAEAEAFLRNAVGSRECEFVFDLVAENDGPFAARQCDLPLAVHGDGERSLVSHDSGRRCSTTFVPIKRLGRFAHWEARSRDLRPHQIRLHAAESGLRIPGESLYGQVPLIHLSALKRDYRARSRVQRPLHGPLCLHLREVHIPVADRSRMMISAPLTRSFVALFRRLEAPESGANRSRPTGG